VSGTRVGLLLPLLFVAVGGCSSVSSGEPLPHDSADRPTTTQPAVTSSTAPTRPREIRLNNVDACSLLPEADYPDYYLDKPGKPSTDDNGAPTCAWFGDVGYMDVNLVTYEGVEAQEGRFGKIDLTEPIEGFPAYTIVLPDDDNRCFIAVDVAEGQYLDVQIGLDAFPAEVTSVCDYAHQFASSIMSTLVKR
jgi:hypothetical protein